MFVVDARARFTSGWGIFQLYMIFIVACCSGAWLALGLDLHIGSYLRFFFCLVGRL